MKNAEIFKLSLPYLGTKDRTVRVYVPAREEGETFPVIYMTDGQNLFEEEGTPFGSWFTHTAVENEQKENRRAAIIVGIHNDFSPMQRTNELTPKSIGAITIPPEVDEETRNSFSPEGEIFDDFVVNTVMPAVERNFPVKKGRNNTAFCGSSSGGLQSFYTVLSHPDLFCAAGAFSPAFIFYTPENMQNWILSVLKSDTPYLYLYSGGADELEQQIYQSTEQVYDILTEIYPPEKFYEVILFENKHCEAAWREIFKDFLHTFLTRRDEF